MGVFSVTVPRVSDTLRSQIILGNLNSTGAELTSLQNKISSGKRINTPSDDPFDATVAGQLQGFLAQKDRFQQNIDNALGVLSTADSALGEAANAVTEAHSTGLGEIGVTANEQTRESAAVVIDEILNNLI